MKANVDGYVITLRSAMDTIFDGASVQLMINGNVVHIRNLPYPGFTCSLGDLQQIWKLAHWNMSGSIILANQTILECLQVGDTWEFRQDGQTVARILPDAGGNSTSDLTGLYMAMRSATEGLPDDFELHAAHGCFLCLERDGQTNIRQVAVHNLVPDFIGHIHVEDLVVFRQALQVGTSDYYLSNLHVQVGLGQITLSPDNRPRPLLAGQRQIFRMANPIELSSAQAELMLNSAEFLLEFEDVTEDLV